MKLHSKKMQRKYPKPCPERPFECPICLKSFLNSGTLSRHKRKTHNNVEGSKYFCNDCQKSFSVAAALKNHTAIYHSNAEPDLPCPISGCSKLFITSLQLQSHLKTHTKGKRRAVCPMCGLFYCDKQSLDKHMKRIHLKIKDFSCDLCDYRASFKKNIGYHVSEFFMKTKARS
jgi:KRAB domain-containing zinc finger protein